ncbi:hypothetical protein C8Q75DRAFT_358504 [Abortiporus biennis]|nr:hypothetical protein C8Q75DRAFT_358504 [Abortiporus biennis]
METRASKRQKVTGQSNVASNPPKTTRSRPRATTKGILKHMPDMPLDILIEIFGYMAPQDLLNLSRSLKSFRGVLTSRTSRPFWRNAFKNIQEEVPEMPPMLNELQWANLLFSDHCHECCKAGVEFIEWAFWTRYCDECREKLIVSWRIHQSLLAFLPSTAPASLPFMPNLRLISFASYSSMLSLYIGTAFADHSPEEVINIKQVNSLRREWDALDPTDRKKFTAERVAQIDESREHSDRCARFEVKKRQEMQLQQEAIRRERINSVKRKFSELGFGPVMDRFSKSIDSTFRSDQQVNQSKVLTDDEWPKIRNQYLKMFNKFKKEHLVLQRLENTEKRLSMVRRILEKLKETEGILSPHPRDFCQLPEIRRIVDGPKDDLMPLKISEDDFLNAHRSQIDQAITNWKKSSEESLKALAQEAAPCVLQSVDPMNLAVGMFFTCGICANTPVMTFPSLLHHGCVDVRWKISPKSKDPYHCALRKGILWLRFPLHYTQYQLIHSFIGKYRQIGN